MPATYSKSCQSYQKFKTAAENDLKCTNCLNPITGSVGGASSASHSDDNLENRAQINDTMHVLLRASVLQCMVTFEAFLHGLLREAFDEVCTSASTFDICRKMFQNKNHPKGTDDSRDAAREKRLEDLTSPRLCKIKLCMQNLFNGGRKEPPCWESDLFKKMLFEKEEFKIILQIPDNDTLGISTTSPFTRASYVIKDYSTVSALLDLFYGVRCISAHGNAAITFGPQGCLAAFDAEKLNIEFQKYEDSTKRDFKLTKEDIQRYFKNIHDALKNAATGGSALGINYHLYLNISNFVRRLAKNLTFVVGCLTYKFQDKEDKTGNQFWGTDIADWRKYASGIFSKSDDSKSTEYQKQLCREKRRSKSEDKCK